MATLNSTLRQYLSMDRTAYHERDYANQRPFTFVVPVDVWKDTLPPELYSATPVELGGSGFVLDRDIDYRSEPGYVVFTMVCGSNGRWWYEPNTKVSSRLVTVRKKFTTAINGDPLTGPVTASPNDQRYSVDGDDSYDEVYSQITITALFAGLIPNYWQGSNFGKYNDGAVTIRGITYPTGTVRFVGCGSEDASGGWIKLIITLMAGGTAVATTKTRYVDKLWAVKIPYYDGAVLKGYTRATNWVRDTTSGVSKTVFASFNMGAAIAELP